MSIKNMVQLLQQSMLLDAGLLDAWCTLALPTTPQQQQQAQQQLEHWENTGIILCMQCQSWMSWIRALSSHTASIAPLILRYAYPLLQQLQRCLAESLTAAEGGGSITCSKNVCDAALELQGYILEAVARVRTDCTLTVEDLQELIQLIQSEVLFAAAAQHMTGACAALRKHAQQQQQQQQLGRTQQQRQQQQPRLGWQQQQPVCSIPAHHEQLLHLLPGNAQAFIAAVLKCYTTPTHSPPTAGTAAAAAAAAACDKLLRTICVTARLLEAYSLAHSVLCRNAVAAGRQPPAVLVSAADRLALAVELQQLLAVLYLQQQQQQQPPQQGAQQPPEITNIERSVRDVNDLLQRLLHEIADLQQRPDSMQRLLLRSSAGGNALPPLLAALAAPLQLGLSSSSSSSSAGEQVMALRAALDICGCRLAPGEHPYWSCPMLRVAS
jgi:hypothetical protein